MRRLSAGKRDANEDIVFAAFREAGCAVIPISKTGAPDAVIFCTTGVYLVEVKSAKGKLTEAQQKWRASWTGPQPHTIRDVESALKLAKGKL